MASKADKGRLALPPPADDGPSQVSVLLVQAEALHEDERIRTELKRQGFRVKLQTLVHLSKDDARHFVFEVSDPSSALHDHHHHHSHLYAESGMTALPNASSLETSTSDDGTEALPHDKPRASGDRVDGESLEDAVCALASGPALMLALEKPNAVSDLLELVGSSSNPELWPPSSLRARFGKNPQALGVRCSLHESTVALEIEFLLACSGPNRKQSQLNHHQPGKPGSKNASKSADVDLEQLLAFLFPAHLQHPSSAGRLFVFGLYGPLDAKARLRSGEKGMHVVTDQELTTMSRRMEREDILSVYRMCSLAQDEEEHVLAQVDQLLKSFPQYTPRDIRTLFTGLTATHEDTGDLSFHAMQTAIMKERCRRVLCMKEKLHPALAPPIQNKFRQTLKRLMKTQDEVAPASLFLKDTGFTGAENATLVSRLLSNHSFEICHLDDGNAPALTQNVRLLREQIRPTDETREPWNPSCQHYRK